MTNKEIDELEAGEILNALTAEKVMGWIPHRRNSAYYVDTSAFDSVGEGFVIRESVLDWKPSADIADAWRVVEKMRQSGHGQKFADCYINETPWHWVFLKTEWFCLHICRAALKVVLAPPSPNTQSAISKGLDTLSTTVDRAGDLLRAAGVGEGDR